MKRSFVSEILSFLLTAASLFLFYRCVEFLAEKDYVAGIVTAIIAVLVIRSGTEFGRYAAFKRKDE
jgi:NhaP-type Na+/H+ or K+/H+ antiporter